jgi:hypothetical protein
VPVLEVVWVVDRRQGYLLEALVREVDDVDPERLEEAGRRERGSAGQLPSEPSGGAGWGRADDDPLVPTDLTREPIWRVAVGDDDVLLRSVEAPERADEAQDELLDSAGLASGAELRVDRDPQRAAV